MKTANGLTVGEKKAVDKLIRGLRELYGANLSRVILYGSKARGDATEDSDVDVMVMLRDYRDWNAEFDKVSELVNAVMEDYNYDLLISFVIKKEEDYSAGLTPLLLNVRKEGVSLWAR
ncbi:MAG: nucleotidyltransferase domain-containing protein [Elusimicrobia bacterium]|nr:nucleotidyltransferase domain-containing protein [Elusimicrobiota bacterium]